MLYSTQSHQSNVCDRLASVSAALGTFSAASQVYFPESSGSDRLSGAIDLHRRRAFLLGATMQQTHIFGAEQISGAKEAHDIGMTRGYPISHSKFLSCLHRGFVAARFALLAALLIAPAFSLSAYAQTAGGWNSRGQKAELREDYDAAYEAYLHAHQKAPKDMRYTARLDRMRFQAAADHVDRGRVLRQNGDVAGALNQFTRALQIDPGNEAATQEIQITQRQDQSSSVALPAQGTTDSDAILHDIASVSAPVALKPVSNDPITLHMVEDAKNIYLAIGKAAGLNVLFDPDLTTKRIPVDLTNVVLSDSLRIVGLLSGTFYKPVTTDTVYVAAASKHGDLDELALQTFYLSNASQASDIQEIATTIRNMLPADIKIMQSASQNALIVRGTPDELLLVQKIINDLDRTKAEVVVDVAILEVNRDKIRNLGITLPQTVGITPQASDTVTTTSTSSTTTNSAFTLNTLANMKATNFAVTIGGGTLNALLSDADTRVLQNPSIRATDGQTATMKIGSKIPVATGSYSSGVSTGSVSLGVQTQFTYLDVGVNIEMTPTIHLDREVSLKLSVEVSTQSGSVTISGVTEPIIGTRSSKSTIQLRDGEPCLLAGIITKTDSNNNSGTPGFSQIPLLKYFFGSVYKENQQDEVVFILVPHIVRESVVTPLNTRLIDTGTGKDYQLRRASASETLPDAAFQPTPTPAQTTSAANAASAMVQQLKQQTMPPLPRGAKITATNDANAAVTGAPVVLTVLPLNSTQSVGGTFTARVLLSNAHDIFSVPLELQFDPKILQLVNVDSGSLLTSDGQAIALVHRDQGNGTVAINASRSPGANGVNGVNHQGEICILTFKAIAAGDTNIALTKVGAKNSLQESLHAVGSQAVVHVK
jgi:general secretion pathway protein D